jgi:hypothetical protein
VSDYGGYAPQYRGGCGVPVLATILLAGGLFLVAMGAGGGGSNTHTTTTTEVMSRNQMLSNNRTNVTVAPQVNLWSDVRNCWGDGSCPTVIVTDTTTVVAGDRSDVTVQGGLPVCLDPTTGAYTSSACGGTYAGGQP